MRTKFKCCKTMMMYDVEVCVVLKRRIMERRYLGILYSIYCKTDKFPSLTPIKSAGFCYSFLVIRQVPGGSNIFLWLGLSSLLLESFQISFDLYNKV